MPITRVKLITISIVTIYGTTLRPIFCILENFRRKFVNLVATPTNGTTKRLVRCKVHPVPWKMAKRASKSIHWRRYPSSKCYESNENLWFRIWRSAVAPSDSAEKNGAQLQSLWCPKIFWKIYFLYDFWGAQSCLLPAVFGILVQTLTIAVSAT